MSDLKARGPGQCKDCMTLKGCDQSKSLVVENEGKVRVVHGIQ